MAEISSTVHVTFRVEGEDKNTANGAQPTPTNPEQPAKPNPENPTAPKGGAKQIAGFAVAGYAAKQAVGYAASHVEMFTGSSQKQQQVNIAMKGIGYATAIMANPAMGLAALALEGITSMIDYSFKRKWEDKATEQLRQRSGYYSEERSR